MHTIKQHFSLCESLVENEALNVELSRGSGDWNKKCCTVVAWCEQHGNLSIILRMRKERPF